MNVILPTLDFFHSIPRLPSENGGVFDRTTEKLKWNRYIILKVGVIVTAWVILLSGCGCRREIPAQPPKREVPASAENGAKPQEPAPLDSADEKKPSESGCPATEPSEGESPSDTGSENTNSNHPSPGAETSDGSPGSDGEDSAPTEPRSESGASSGSDEPNVPASSGGNPAELEAAGAAEGGIPPKERERVRREAASLFEKSKKEYKNGNYAQSFKTASSALERILILAEVPLDEPLEQLRGELTEHCRQCAGHFDQNTRGDPPLVLER